MLSTENLERCVYRLAVLSAGLILLWIGAFKFTHAEAQAIVSLVEHHPLMGWLYKLLSVQAVSNLIGIAEILVGVGLVLALKIPKIGLYAGIGGGVIFLTTMSFLITTPGAWHLVEGFPVCNFFILKDLGYLAISAWVAIRGIAAK